nr:MAG TPA_asm: hypothetical protein [Caudoviricetes sp.]DAL43888.1 MAG TPA_asm: hypothetical protein [Caudoviricetes sp.]
MDYLTALPVSQLHEIAESVMQITEEVARHGKQK